ncbi:hypothetical protein EG329_005080 [Mollisiaceae sp. DMI_Dod_QoI]|nr:hypothetical protein EG329_005080 [Helotiales sp. DMI_Dod_QoI]
MATNLNRMAIGAMLNPSSENLENIGKEQVEHSPISTFFYDLPIQSRGIPVEIRQHYYPTPENSPALVYSSTVSSPVSRLLRCGALPPMRTEQHDYPSPPLSMAAYFPTQQPLSYSPRDVSERHNPPQQLGGHHLMPSILSTHPSTARNSFHPTNILPSPHHQTSHRASRSKRDCLHRMAGTLSSPSNPHLHPYPNSHASASASTSPPPYLQTSQSTLTKDPRSRKKPKNGTASNEAYTQECVDFMRYHRIDLAKSWPEVCVIFKKMFLRTPKTGGASSRYYRDNNLVTIDADGRLMKNAEGKQLWTSMQVREKDLPHLKGMPWSFVERYPWAAIGYSWVDKEDKVEAERIIKELEGKTAGEYTRKEQYILAFREYSLEKFNSQTNHSDSKHSQIEIHPRLSSSSSPPQLENINNYAQQHEDEEMSDYPSFTTLTPTPSEENVTTEGRKERKRRTVSSQTLKH